MKKLAGKRICRDLSQVKPGRKLKHIYVRIDQVAPK